MFTVSATEWNLFNILGNVSAIAILCVNILTSPLTLSLDSAIPTLEDSV